MLWVSGRTDGHETGRLTARDGVVIPYRRWWRERSPASVLLLHGQGMHSGPMASMGDELLHAGYSVYAHDHRGFGLSQAPRGDIPTYDHFIHDTLEMAELAHRQNPGRPVFLIGLSMGGHIALRSAVRAGSGFAGVVALSPGFKLKRSPAWNLVLRVGLLSVLKPRTLIPPLGEGVVTTRNQLHLDRAQEDEHWVTSFTARFHVQTVLSIRRAWWELRKLKVPTLFLQAGEDHLVCPAESRRFFERIACPDKEFRLMDGLCHNLVAEPEMPDLAKIISEWMAARCRPRLNLV